MRDCLGARGRHGHSCTLNNAKEEQESYHTSYTSMLHTVLQLFSFSDEHRVYNQNFVSLLNLAPRKNSPVVHVLSVLPFTSYMRMG